MSFILSQWICRLVPDYWSARSGDGAWTGCSWCREELDRILCESGNEVARRACAITHPCFNCRLEQVAVAELSEDTSITSERRSRWRSHSRSWENRGLSEVSGFERGSKNRISQYPSGSFLELWWESLEAVDHTLWSFWWWWIRRRLWRKRRGTTKSLVYVRDRFWRALHFRHEQPNNLTVAETFKPNSSD